MHDQAEKAFNDLHLFKEISEYDSRLMELVNYFGWEVGHKAHFCRVFYFDEYEKEKYENAKNKLGVTDIQYRIMHQYTHFNRLSPDRHDVYYIYDDILKQLEILKRNNRDLEILDFGCGLGQIGVAFAFQGYPVHFIDTVPEFLDFARYLCETRSIKNAVFENNGSSELYTSSRRNRAGLIIEWSTFEHLSDPLSQLIEFSNMLVKGGLIITTSLKKDWDDNLVDIYSKDGGSDVIERLSSTKINDFIDHNFTVVSNDKCLAKVLIKK